MYLDPDRPGVEDIIDQIVAGVRSACTYAGAVDDRRSSTSRPSSASRATPATRKVDRRGRPGERPRTGLIAIDGPAGAGKSTVGRALASRLGVGYLDTGAMYRAMTFAAFAAVWSKETSTRSRQWRPTSRSSFDEGLVLVDGVDATVAIRGREVTEAVSQIAANPTVREVLVARQRAWVDDHGGGVVEGRDIGSVVFPDADLKLYVTASPRVRAERRVREIGGDVDEVERSIIQRDRYDAERDHSPLTEAEDAVTVDTTGMSIDEVVEHILALLPEDFS